MEKIFLVDDHPLMREGLAAALDSSMGLEVCGQAESAEEAIDQIDELQPDLVLLDISLPGMSGLELLKQLQSMYSELPVLVVSRHDEELYAKRVLEAGGRGYVMKQAGREELVKAIRQVLDGRVYMSPDMTDQLLQEMAGGKGGSERVSPMDSLSDRELEVFELTGRGLGPEEIAERMYISPKTVQSYKTRIKEKLGLDSSRQLVRHAVQWVEEEAH